MYVVDVSIIRKSTVCLLDIKLYISLYHITSYDKNKTTMQSVRDLKVLILKLHLNQLLERDN